MSPRRGEWVSPAPGPECSDMYPHVPTGRVAQGGAGDPAGQVTVNMRGKESVTRVAHPQADNSPGSY